MKRAAAAVGLGLVAASTAARAADIQWNVADGNWADGANWVGGVVPGTTDPLDRALVDFATSGATAHVNTDVPDFFSLSVKNGNIISIEAGGVLRTIPEDLVTPPPANDPLLAIRIGDGSAGSVTITDGQLINAATTLDQRADIYAGVTDALAVGGTGTITQNGAASLLQARDIRVGNGAGSVGTYNHNAGTISVNWALAGRAGGTGTYNLDGGTANVNQWHIGNGTGSVGTFNFLSGAVNAAQEVNIAMASGEATVTHSGGTITASSAAVPNTANFNIGRGASSNTKSSVANYSLSGTGAISVGQDLQVGLDGGIGKVTMTGGSITVGRDVKLGTDVRTAANQILLSDAQLDQSAGTITTAFDFRVAEQKAKGVYNMTGTAQLTVGDELVVGGTDAVTDGLMTVAGTASAQATSLIRIGTGGGKGAITITGGTVATNDNITVGQNGGGGGSAGRGTLDISAGALNVGGSILVGGGGGVGGASRANSDGLVNISGTANVTVTGEVAAGVRTTVSGVINQSGGTLTSASLATASFAGSVGTFNLSGGTLTTGLVTNNGTFNYTGGTATIGGIAGTGTTAVAAGLNLAADGVTQGAVNIEGKITVRPNGDVTGVSRIGAITLGAAGKLDLTDNKLITPLAAGTWNGTNYTDVAGMVDSARGSAGNAMWDGASGITTSDTRAINNGDLISIGVAKTSEVRTVADTETTTFAGQTVLGSDTIAMATWGGDANLDGKINIDDYGRIDGNVGQSGSVFGWSKGDFNYDGKINIDDYGIIDGNINRQGAAIVTAGSAASLEGVAAVPEPASLSLVALGATALLRRRRRA